MKVVWPLEVPHVTAECQIICPICLGNVVKMEYQVPVFHDEECDTGDWHHKPIRYSKEPCITCECLLQKHVVLLFAKTIYEKSPFHAESISDLDHVAVFVLADDLVKFLKRQLNKEPHKFFSRLIHAECRVVVSLTPEDAREYKIDSFLNMQEIEESLGTGA